MEIIQIIFKTIEKKINTKEIILQKEKKLSILGKSENSSEANMIFIIVLKERIL
jgi:hypothetical protein